MTEFKSFSRWSALLFSLDAWADEEEEVQAMGAEEDVFLLLRTQTRTDHGPDKSQRVSQPVTVTVIKMKWMFQGVKRKTETLISNIYVYFFNP